MSAEASQQNSTQLGARESVYGRSGRGRGRSQIRERGRGRGRGRGFSSHQQSAEPEQSSADHRSRQLPVSVSAHSGATNSHPSGREVHDDRPPLSRDADARQQHSAGPVLQVQAARQQQTRQRPRGHSRQRQAGHRNGGNHLAVAAPAAAGQLQPIQDSSAIADSMQHLPDCVICCEPMQVCCAMAMTKLLLSFYQLDVQYTPCKSRLPAQTAHHICFVQVVSIGKCNHKAVCERCSLRLIMLYQDTRCPLCKADLEQVRLPLASQ